MLKIAMTIARTAQEVQQVLPKVQLLKVFKKCFPCVNFYVGMGMNVWYISECEGR